MAQNRDVPAAARPTTNSFHPEFFMTSLFPAAALRIFLLFIRFYYYYYYYYYYFVVIVFNSIYFFFLEHENRNKAHILIVCKTSDTPDNTKVSVVAQK